jgi:hypothetical protein
VDVVSDPYAGVYERGIAVGHSDVKSDTMVFRFRDEKFELPSIDAMRVARYNGYFYEAHIDDLRRLETEKAGG